MHNQHRILLTMLVSFSLLSASPAMAGHGSTIVIQPTLIIRDSPEPSREVVIVPQPEYDHRDRERHEHHHDWRPGRRAEGIGLAFVDPGTVRVYHRDWGWSGKWNYVCLEDQCYQGTRRGGYFYRDFPAHLGQQYRTEFKVQDDRTGQYITQGSGRFDADDRW